MDSAGDIDIYEKDKTPPDCAKFLFMVDINEISIGLSVGRSSNYEFDKIVNLSIKDTQVRDFFKNF